MVVSSCSVLTFILADGGTCALTPKYMAHIQQLHPNVEIDHLQAALSQCYSSSITSYCTANNFYLNDQSGTDQLIITDRVTDWSEELKFKYRDKNAKRPVRIVDEPNETSITNYLCVCLIRRDWGNEIVSAYWRNPSIQMEHTANFWEKHAFKDEPQYHHVEIYSSLSEYHLL